MPKKRQCYLCHQNPIQTVFTKLGWKTSQCPRCLLYQLEFDLPYSQFIRQYYNKKFFTGSDQRAGYTDYEGDSWPENRNMINYLNGIRQYKQSGHLLDIGCATGLFMRQAAAYFDVYGIDVSHYAVDKARKRFPGRIKLSEAGQAQFKPEQFDCITMFDVLEHLKDPRHDLKHLKKFLQEDGLLVINTGDAGSLLARLQKVNWHVFIPPQHLFYFSKNTLAELLHQAGFKIISIRYQGKWVSLRYLLHLSRQIKKNPLAIFLYPLVKNNFLGKIPLYLNLFDNITVYAKKQTTQ